MKVAHKDKMTINNNHFTSLYNIMIDNDDKINAEKLVDLFEKKATNQFNISFAGHFSAGKSSLINYLLGKDVLPKSPIPTSANIVKIMSGEGVARVFFTEKTPVEYDEPYDIDMIKAYATDKDTIKRIEISTSESILPPNCALLDTPGIDAADDADRLMTESALHIVDVLYYVMDYNHVQSEVNLYFLQKIQKEQIPFYIIINQVDKHNEAELTFQQFNKNVKQTFDQWSIFPERIYYSSAIDESAPNNEIKQIKQDLFTLFQKNNDISNRLYAATKEIVQAHKTYLSEKYDDRLVELSTVDTTDADASRLVELNDQLFKLDNFLNDLKNEMYEELNQTLKNAYLMPAKLRDQAKDFLESQQKDFKVGGLFSAKKKTEEEKTNRMQTFLQQLQKSIEVTIQWKLRDKFNEILRQHQVIDEQLVQNVQKLTVTISEEDLLSFMKSGATINGNYILNYTNDISNDVKQKFRHQVNQLWRAIESVCSEEIAIEKKKLEIEKEQFEALDKILQQQIMMKQRQADELTRIDNLFLEPNYDEKALLEIEEIILKRQVVVKGIASNTHDKEELIVENKKLPIKDKNTEIDPASHYTMKEIVEVIDKVTDEILNLDGFSSIIQDLEEKKQRLSNRELTIALFGAFSAGKSSFSNALFGEQILPVSPNPTTAVISRIAPISKNNPHGTVIITLKTDETLTNDLKSITKGFSPKQSNFNEMVDWIKKEKIYEHEDLIKTYQSYLVAILEGYEARKNNLGQKLEISLEQFSAYVTDESIACYIEAVDLYYDCALTNKGITLVDTPGADSVNARHTNVSFDYIKQADAILYVTYYNHAITSADRDFLMQLGRVKEAFELDKMYFIVNASDLAETEADLQMVLQYVEEQLLQFGIRHPRIFPVSSKRSLQEKRENLPLNNEMTNFEEEFYSFIEKDLPALTIQAAIWDVNRAKSTLKSFIDSANLNENERKIHVQKLNEERESFKKIIVNIDDKVAEKRMLERVERQLHFVLERLFIRFHDMFSEHFNPTTITASGRQAMTQLEHNRNQFIDYVGYELLQEVRAVSLRVESYINELVNNLFQNIQQEINKVDTDFMLPSIQEIELETPLYKQAFLTLSMDVFANALKVFKNTRSFFEQNEREKMKDLFYELLQPYAKQYLDEQKVIMEEAYIQQWNKEITAMKTRVELEVNSIIDQNIKVLTETVDIAALVEKHNKIKNLLEKIN